MSAFSASDHRHMARALQLAERGLYTTEPNPRVGCVIARGETVLGEGYHARAGEPHAEVHALRDAGDAARGATAYVTLEPCSHHGRTPPCCEALARAGVARVVAAMRDPNPQVAGSGLSYLREQGIEVQDGLMQAQAHELNPGFISRMTRGRPWVRVKLAASLDGRTAMASGESQWITGPAARHDVQLLRARAGCVLTGSGTVLSDDPSLNLRLSAEELGIDGEVRQPLRAVIDSQLLTPETAKMLALDGEVLLFTASEYTHKNSALINKGAVLSQVSARDGKLDLQAVMAVLARRDVNEVHVEAGAGLAGALMAANLVDEIVLYLAPLLMGDGARGLFQLPAIENMAQRVPLKIHDLRQIGGDVRLTLRTAGEA